MFHSYRTTKSKFADKIIQKFSFGGGCINDTVIHFSNNRLPFGGVGNSGIGAYHGKMSFDTFSHKKAIVKKANWLDLPMRYAPYKGKLSQIKKILRLNAFIYDFFISTFRNLILVFLKFISRYWYIY